MQSGESLRDNLKECEGRRVWPKRRRENELIALLDNFKLWNHGLDGIVGFNFLYHVAK